MTLKKWEGEDHWVEIDLDLCVGAGECVQVCPTEVYEVVDGKVVAENIGECIDCMACDGVCPTSAIVRYSAWS